MQRFIKILALIAGVFSAATVFAQAKTNLFVASGPTAGVYYPLGGGLADVLTKAHFWQTHADLSFNLRQRAVVTRLLDGFEGKLTSSKWATLAKCSQDTALRDIDGLVRAGVVAKDAAGGRSTSYSLVMAARPFSAADIVKRAKALGVTSTEATQMIRRSRDVRNRKR